MDEPDRQQLIGFVLSTQRTLELIVFPLGDLVDPEEGGTPDSVGLRRAAWVDLMERAEFDRMESAIASRNFDERLDRYGLSGAQLRFKLALVADREAEVQQVIETLEPGLAPLAEQPSAWRRRIRGILRRLLGAIDVVLDSLVGALQGVGEVVKEFKQALEQRLND